MTTPGTALSGREYDKARESIDRALSLTYTRAETARRATHTVLAYLGSRRITEATRPTPDGAETRRILSMLADIETACDRLDAIPRRTEAAAARHETWSVIADQLAAVRHRLGTDHTVNARIA